MPRRVGDEGPFECGALYADTNSGCDNHNNSSNGKMRDMRRTPTVKQSRMKCLSELRKDRSRVRALIRLSVVVVQTLAQFFVASESAAAWLHA
mmetsp:Transcript_1553/g.4244  ORF Transcript_1553/g.4244 Transcript_1553/m.4244 type:complete len:93 (+) Transcript_1553:174-452(+)